jgi:hypothetical protein
LIHISICGKMPSDEWLEKAASLTQMLEDAQSPEERNRIIDNNKEVWGELKDWLLKLSHGKCWFSEARDIYSHVDVEHFRPKKGAKDLDGLEREGYWWLSFDWKNYRICGNVGNRKKGTFFPLLPESFVATSTNRTIEDESPYFLDPTNVADTCLLSFNEEGEAIPMPSCGGLHKERVLESVKRFKLNDHPALLEARRTVWRKCREIVDDCKVLLKDLETTVSPTKRERVRINFERLKEMVRPSAELSSTAMECLKMSGYDWAQRIASQ